MVDRTVRPGQLPTEASYALDTASPAVALLGAGNDDADPRRTAWARTDMGAYLTALRDRARDELTSRMGRAPSERDLNELDRRLEVAMGAVGGRRGTPEASYYYAPREVDRVCMPHYAPDDTAGEESNGIRARYGIRNGRRGQSDATAAAADPANEVVKLVVEQTLPFTAVSQRDDILFKQESWRSHTSTDVAVGTAATTIPMFQPPNPTMPHAKGQQLTTNPRMDDVTDQPLYPDGHPAWFKGWDQFFDSPFPNEMSL
jgi:hypothetical protein